MMAHILSLKLETRLSVESKGEEGKIRGSRNIEKCGKYHHGTQWKEPTKDTQKCSWALLRDIDFGGHVIYIQWHLSSSLFDFHKLWNCTDLRLAPLDLSIIGTSEKL